MPTRNVVLSEHQQQLVETLVQSGRYQNASEVLREGLRLIEERDRREEAKLKALKQAARQGWADVSAGRYADVGDDELEDFVGQLGRRAAQLRAARRPVAHSSSARFMRRRDHPMPNVHGRPRPSTSSARWKGAEVSVVRAAKRVASSPA